MNVFLVPYTAMRHLVVGFWCAGAALLCWWILLLWMVGVGPSWTLPWDGAILLALLAAVTSGASVLAEDLLRRRPLLGVAGRVALAAAISGLLALAAWWLWTAVLAPGLVAPLSRMLVDLGAGEADAAGGGGVALSRAVETDVVDASLVSLRYRFGAFAMAGLATALGPLAVRRFRGALDHLGAGLAAGLVASATWYVIGRTIAADLYLADAAAVVVFGLVFGWFAWGIPRSLYAGWIRVLSPWRFGHRIPIDGPDGSPKERFVGHFPRGLDLFLPLETGVQEMHLSVAVDAKQRYVARGLTLAPTTLRRFLERIDLRYDPRRPAPLETNLSSGDRIVLGQGRESSELEFLMLPREER